MRNTLLLGLAVGAAIAWMRTEKGKQFCNELSDTFGEACEMLSKFLRETKNTADKETGKPGATEEVNNPL